MTGHAVSLLTPEIERLIGAESGVESACDVVEPGAVRRYVQACMDEDPMFHADDARYGGPGVTNPISDEGWSLPGETSIALRAIPQTKPRRKPKERHAPKAEQ